MNLANWRELYASNRAVIEQAGVPALRLPAAPPWTRPRLPLSIPAHAPAGDLAEHPAGAWEPLAIEAGGRSRHAWVHSPAGTPPDVPMPVVCMLHGCTQDAATFAIATRMNAVADRHGFVVVYPEQERGDNPQTCWNWFRRDHQARRGGEPAWIAAIVAELMGTRSIDARRVFVAGLSAGGAMAAILGATHPDLFAAVGVHSGLAYGSAASVPGAFSAMARGGGDGAERGRAAHAAMGPRACPMPGIVVHGSADRTVAPDNAYRILEQWFAADRLAGTASGDLDLARPAVVEHGRVDGGHAYARSRWTDARGALTHEYLRVDGMGHAWSGGAAGGSYADHRGPDAAEAMWRFFAEVTADAPTHGPVS